jgi:hypothetical protein
MPYYFGEGDPGWDELRGEDDDDRPPRVSQFRYLPPPDVGGTPDPVHLSDQVPEPPPASRPRPAPAPSLLDRMLGRRPPAPASVRHPTWQEQQQEQERRGQHWLALVMQGLREMGVRRVYGRCDGGNDEGFAWADHVELRSGERLAPGDAGARLAGTELRARLIDADLWSEEREINLRANAEEYGAMPANLGEIALNQFAEECAALLLGRGYGTGPFWLYGAFTVDLDACTIVDDRNAEPIVSNIRIET